MFRVVALCAVSILLPVVAPAQANPGSATWVMPGCRTYVSDTGWNENGFKAGICTGIVRGISYMDGGGMCTPEAVTQDQRVRVVAHYIDARPARQHESFTKLAVEALRAAWPCHR
jgi:Rap1a immunity proteins